MEEKIEVKNKEIDFIGIIKRILAERILLTKIVGGFTILGILVALVNPKEYTSEVILAPEMSTGGVGLSESLASMASTFGIDLGGKSTMDAIYPEIYPTVLLSNDFIISLLDVKVHKKEDTTRKRFYDYINKDLRTGFWGYPAYFLSSLLPKKEVSSNNTVFDPTHLTKSQEKIVDYIKGSISCIVDGKTRIITIGVKDQDPQVATIIVDTIQKHLRDYIIEYRTKKAKNDLVYYQKLLNESKKEYLQSQKKYADYSEANTKIALTSVETRLSELENEMQLKFNIYNQISTQVQQAKAKIQEQTRAFTIIQQASVPNKASSTPRSIIVILYFIFGGIVGSFYILLRKDIKRIFHHIKK